MSWDVGKRKSFTATSIFGDVKVACGCFGECLGSHIENTENMMQARSLVGISQDID